MSFGLVVFDKAHVEPFYDFANANGVKTKPIDTVREISFDEDEIWELSRALPRLYMDSHASESGHTFWLLELEPSMNESRAQLILNGHRERLFRKVFVDEYVSGVRLRERSTGLPRRRQAQLKDIAFWPANPQEQRATTSYFEQKLLKAA